MSEPETIHVMPSGSGPINDLVFALNYYMATGDHVGEGHAIAKGTHTSFALPYAPRELEDRDNWERLRARLEQINDAQTPEEQVPILIENAGQQSGFVMMVMTVADVDMPRLTNLLKAQPGPRGWGGMRGFLIEHGIIGDADKGED